MQKTITFSIRLTIIGLLLLMLTKLVPAVLTAGMNDGITIGRDWHDHKLKEALWKSH